MLYPPNQAVNIETTILASPSVLQNYASTIAKRGEEEQEKNIKLAVNPFNAKIMLTFISKPFEVIKAIINSADPKKVKKVMNEYTASVGLTFLHIGAFNPDIRVLELLLKTAKEHKIDINKFININSPKSNSYSYKDGGKTRGVNFSHNWTALNIALDNGDLVKIKFLEDNGLNQLSLKSYDNDYQGSLFHMATKGWTLAGSYVTDEKKLTSHEVLSPRLALCDMSLELQSWANTFNYSESDTLEEKINKARIFKTPDTTYQNLWIPFQSEKCAQDREFKTVIAVAFFRDYLNISKTGQHYYGLTDRLDMFLSLASKGINQHQEAWSTEEIKRIYDLMQQITQEVKKEKAPSHSLVQSNETMHAILEKRMLSLEISEKSESNNTNNVSQAAGKKAKI